MLSRDARTLSQAAQHEIRRQAIKLHLKGDGPSSIAKTLDVHRNAVADWIKLYKGMKGLAIGKRGPKPGTNLQLDESKQKEIRKRLIEKNPEQLKLPFALWSREAVGLLIQELTGYLLNPCIHHLLAASIRPLHDVGILGGKHNHYMKS